MPPLLSACLIVRDEEAFIEGCLNSLRGRVAETVVLDTGSRDRTVALCRDFGARVHTTSWVGDFAKARNQALGLCRGGWILSIDADERVRPASWGRLKGLLASPRAVAGFVRLHPKTGWTGVPALRVFRNTPRLRFQGTFHESIAEDLHARLREGEGEIGETGLVLDHLGYDQDPTAKARRNLPFLLEAVARNPENPLFWNHLGVTRDDLGDSAGAEEAWARAVSCVRSGVSRRPQDVESYVYALWGRIRAGRPCSPLLAEALGLWPANPFLVWFRARTWMEEGRFAEALPLLARLLRWGEVRDFDRTMSYDARIFGEFAADSLGVCLFRLGVFREAQAAFGRAEAANPGEKAYGVKRCLCEGLAGGAP